MMKLCSSLLLLATAVNAYTKVAVVELGVGGTVRRTSSKSTESTVEGVNSFLQSMHGGRKLQHAGMTVVPDLFQKADSGVILGLSGQGVDVAEMPAVAALLEDEKDGVVGHLSTNGQHCQSLLSRAKSVDLVSEDVSLAVEKSANKPSLTAVDMKVQDSNAASKVDGEVASLIRDMHKKNMEQGKTVVLYLVVEEDASVSRRRLNDGGGQAQGGQYQAGKIYFFSKSQGNNGGNADNNPYAQMFAGYYGYGYYNSYGEWVTPYKSMFQIQYFNVVLWTAFGLAVVLIWVIMAMMYMPLEPDTLLFGESAKMIGDD
mmetsp:Transcript_7677/g.21357  ORF Transcript_7677/g.21357 Transcript_7677/m.21357 type:complete len:315 (+) Transcript_7677:42-986(+)